MSDLVRALVKPETTDRMIRNAVVLAYTAGARTISVSMDGSAVTLPCTLGPAYVANDVVAVQRNGKSGGLVVGRVGTASGYAPPFASIVTPSTAPRARTILPTELCTFSPSTFIASTPMQVQGVSTALNGSTGVAYFGDQLAALNADTTQPYSATLMYQLVEARPGYLDAPHFWLGSDRSRTPTNTTTPPTLVEDVGGTTGQLLTDYQRTAETLSTGNGFDSSAVRSTADAHTGSACWAMTTTGNTQSYALSGGGQARYVVTAGQTVVLAGFVKPLAAAGRWVEWKSDYYLGGSYVGGSYANGFTATANAWSPFQVLFTIPSGVDHMTLVVGANTGAGWTSGETLEWDDIALAGLPAASPVATPSPGQPQTLALPAAWTLALLNGSRGLIAVHEPSAPSYLSFATQSAYAPSFALSVSYTA